MRFTMATLVKTGRLILANSNKLNALYKSTLFSRIVASRGFCQSSSLLSGRRYSEKHEWVSMEGNIGTVGISQYAQDSLGDIVYVQLPEEGDEYDMEDECGALESVKAASEIFCPLSGKVTAKNGNVEDTPGLINKSPYDDGWLFKLELKNPEELDQMMDEDTYQSFLKAQQEE